MKEASRGLIEKARRSIEAARILLDHGDSDFAASRAYYAMFYAAEALLHERGLRSQKHSGVHALFGEHLAKTGVVDAKLHRWLLDAFDKRVGGDYELTSGVSHDEVSEMIAQACEFLDHSEKSLGLNFPNR